MGLSLLTVRWCERCNCISSYQVSVLADTGYSMTTFFAQWHVHTKLLHVTKRWSDSVLLHSEWRYDSSEASGCDGKVHTLTSKSGTHCEITDNNSRKLDWIALIICHVTISDQKKKLLERCYHCPSVTHKVITYYRKFLVSVWKQFEQLTLQATRDQWY